MSQHRWRSVGILLCLSFPMGMVHADGGLGLILGQLAIDYAAGKAIDHALGVGGSDTTGLRHEIDRLAESHADHAEILRELANDIGNCARREEVNDLLFRALQRIDERWAGMVREMEQQKVQIEGMRQSLTEQGRKLGLSEEQIVKMTHRLDEAESRLHAQAVEIAGVAANLEKSNRRHANAERLLQRGIDSVKSETATLANRVEDVQRGLSCRVEAVKERTGRLETDMVELREVYPRSLPSEQAAKLGVTGMRWMERKNYGEALKAFHFGHATDESDPAHLIGMAICLRNLGQGEEAEQAMAKAIVAERTRPMPAWYLTCLERMSPQDRFWVTEHRHEPFYGTTTSGELGRPAL